MRDFSDRKINGGNLRVRSKGRSHLTVVTKFYWPELQDLLNSSLEPRQHSIAQPRDQKLPKAQDLATIRARTKRHISPSWLINLGFLVVSSRKAKFNTCLEGVQLCLKDAFSEFPKTSSVPTGATSRGKPRGMSGLWLLPHELPSVWCTSFQLGPAPGGVQGCRDKYWQGQH